jgi:hypothetical protein
VHKSDSLDHISVWGLLGSFCQDYKKYFFFLVLHKIIDRCTWPIIHTLFHGKHQTQNKIETALLFARQSRDRTPLFHHVSLSPHPWSIAINYYLPWCRHLFLSNMESITLHPWVMTAWFTSFTYWNRCIFYVFIIIPQFNLPIYTYNKSINSHILNQH